MSARRCLSIAAAAGLAAAGCASVPRDAGFADVRRQVEERSGQDLEWEPGQPVTAPASDDAVRPLLQGELTADRAVEIALAHNRDLLATLEELGIARAGLIRARTVRNPVIDGEIRFPGAPRNPFEIALTQTLIELFQLRGRRALGEAAFEAQRLRVTGAVLAFAAEVRGDWYTLVAARQALAQQRAITAAAEAAAELARRQHEAGNITDLDLEGEQALYEQAKLDLARVELDELLARERLVADLGLLDPATPLNLPIELPPPQAAERSAEAVDAAVPDRLDMALAKAELEAARRALPIARQEAFDELAAGVHHEQEPEGEATTGPALAVPIPIFDSGLAARARATARLRQAEQRLHALGLAARSQARAARERLLEARARVDYLRTVVVPRRERIVRLTQLEYNAMLRGVYDLLRARQDLADAQREEVLARRDYWLARTELDVALQGVVGFSVRPEREPMPRLDLFRPAERDSTNDEEQEP